MRLRAPAAGAEVSELERWLRRQAARERRIVVLEEGLLGNRLWRYSFYRLRYFFVRYLLESATHAVTVLLFFRDLAWENFLLVLVGFAATSLGSSFWWGALEAMRAQVRDLYRSGRPHRIAGTIGGWLTLSVVLAVVVVAIAVGWTAWRAADGSFEAAEAYVLALLLRLALDLPIRCYHSGVYALRRVYKPLGATVAPDLVGLAVIAVLFPLVGVWALVGSALAVTALVGALDIRYIRRVYHFLGLAPLREATAGALRGSVRGAGREAFAGGAAYAVMALDSLIVLALLYGAQTDSETLVVLFVAGPTIRAGFDWARILYFDLKRLELRLFTNLRRRFERHTAELAWALAIVFWAIAAGIATGVVGRGLGSFYAVLLAFFCARSLLARAQIQAFAEGSYAIVLGTGAACVGGLVAAGALAESENERLAAVALVTAVCTAALTWLSRRARARGEPGTALLTLEWLRRLGHARGAVRVGSARLASAPGPQRLDARTREEGNRWRLMQLADRVARRLGGAGAAAWMGPDLIVWFEAATGDPRVSAEWLQRAAGGLIGEVRVRDCPTGEEALLAAGQEGLLGRASEHLLTAVVPVDVAAARRTFEELLPGALVYSPDEAPPPALAALPGSELRAILVDAVAFARELRVRRRQSRFDVTALCSGGELRLIFVAELEDSRRARGRWRHVVTMLDVRAAIAGDRPGRARRRRLPRAALARA
jgi:hypothetical protein